MKSFKIVIIIFLQFLLFFNNFNAQNIDSQNSTDTEIVVGWITNPAINKISDDFKDKALQLIDDGATALIITGKLTANGTLDEFKQLKRFATNLSVPVKVLPSFSDLYSTPYSELNYNEYFDDRNFILVNNNFSLVGLNLLSSLNSFTGHFSPNAKDWLNDEIESLDDSTFFFLFSNFTPSQTDNWQTLEYALKGKRLPTIFVNSPPREISNRYYFIYTPLTRSFRLISIKNSKIIVKDLNGDLQFSQSIDRNIEPLNSIEIEPRFNAEQSFVKKIWQNNVESTTSISPVIYKNKFYLLQNDGLLTCFDEDGSTFWDYDLLADVRVNPGVIDGFFVAATLQGDLFSIRASNGEQLQTIGFETPVTTDLLLFEFPRKVNTMATKTSGSNGVVVFGDAKGNLFCYDIETFEKIWNNRIAHSPIKGKPIYSGNQIIFRTVKTIFSVNVLNGSLLWKWNLPSENEKFGGNILEDKNNLFLFSDKGNIYSLDKNLGTLNWNSAKYKTSGIGLSYNNEHIFIKSNNKLILADKKECKFIKSFPVETEPTSFYNNIQSKNGLTFLGNRYKIFRIKDERKYSTIISSENSPVTYFKYFGKNKLLILNIDGTLALFEIDE